jgi:DNA-binding SARP family transcriptional activator
LFKDECYYCNPEIDINIDVEEFRKTWRSAQSLEHAKNLPAATSKFERAARLYKGDFLEDEMYDSWNSLDRENLREIYLVILDRLSKFYIENGQVITANSLCEKIIQKDNCREDIHRRLMRCHYYSGQRFKAIRQFRKCKIILKNELEVAPDKKTVELYEQIKQGALKSKL